MNAHKYLIACAMLVGCSRPTCPPPQNDHIAQTEFAILQEKVNRHISTQEELEAEIKMLREKTAKIERMEKQLTAQIEGLRAMAGSSYTVKEGDTLEKIARRHQSTIAAIKKANNLSKDTIYPGQKLRIPK